MISSIPYYFNNSETPIICYKYNKPIRSTIFNFNKIVPSREKARHTLHVMTEMHFFTSEEPKNIMHGRVKMYVMR